jgi:hypothetical protein
VTDLETFRLLLDDATGALFDDAAVASWLALYASDVRLAVAGAADVLALRFAPGIRKFTTDGQTFERGSRSAGYEALAKRMREAVDSEDLGVTTAYITRIDGNSNDISAEDTGAELLDGTGRTAWRFANVLGDTDGVPE